MTFKSAGLSCQLQLGSDFPHNASFFQPRPKWLVIKKVSVFVTCKTITHTVWNYSSLQNYFINDKITALSFYRHFARLYRWKRQWLCCTHIRPRRLPESEKWSRKKKQKRPLHFPRKCSQTFLFTLYPVCCSLLFTPHFVLLHICSFLNFEISLLRFFSRKMLPVSVNCLLHSDYICHTFANPSVTVARLHNTCLVAVTNHALCRVEKGYRLLVHGPIKKPVWIKIWSVVQMNADFACLKVFFSVVKKYYLLKGV